MKKRIFKIIFSCLALTFAYFLLDISDLPASIGIHSGEINWDIASIVIGNLIVIGLYLITFNLLDNRSIEKDRNQREVALLLIKKTYEKCKESVLYFEVPEVCEKAAEKCDFSKVLHEDKQFLHYLDFPFEYHEKIIEFACCGTISKQEFSDYINVRDAYKKHINIRIMFFDRKELPDQTKKEFFETFDKVYRSLNRGER